VTTGTLPKDWNREDPPPYSYYAYYIWANLYQLNALRATLGLNTFKFRPHCGEAGATHHLATMFLLADGINHGINLAKEPSIQYLYYLTQIGISVSPLSNNALFKKLDENPFYNFLERGLNVTLSTDDPLQFHTCNTSNALMEEYLVAKARWSLTSTDLAEITRNSVLQSGFSHRKKQEYIGSHYRIGGVVGNEEGKTGIPKCRSAFRQEALLEELYIIYNTTSLPFDRHKAIRGTKVEVKRNDGKWIDATITDELPNVDNTKFWTEGIKIRCNSTWWCLKCENSFAKTDTKDGNCTKCAVEKTLSKLTKETVVKDARKIRFPAPRDVPKKDTPWKWTPGSPVTWKDLVVKEPPKISTVDDLSSQSQSHAWKAWEGRVPREVPKTKAGFDAATEDVAGPKEGLLRVWNATRGAPKPFAGFETSNEDSTPLKAGLWRAWSAARFALAGETDSGLFSPPA